MGLLKQIRDSYCHGSEKAKLERDLSSLSFLGIVSGSTGPNQTSHWAKKQYDEWKEKLDQLPEPSGAIETIFYKLGYNI